MATTAPWLTIIGIGEDGRAGLSPAALAALDRADFVIGGARHLALAAPLSAQTQTWPSPFADGYPMILARRGQPTCVLATGDPFHYGVGAELARLVPVDEILCFPQPSAFSLAAARAGLVAAGLRLREPARPGAGADRALAAAGCPHPRPVMGWIDTGKARTIS